MKHVWELKKVISNTSSNIMCFYKGVIVKQLPVRLS